ncbi:MAG TPA: nucleotidyltransferase family protein [Bacteroidales bacterium]|nr:nucleotidyltransferase family protein [Bacteroidales bacterium]
MKENFSAIILAAGSSGRMGQPKALLPFDPQRCFARKLADEFFAFGCNRVVMVTNSHVMEKVRAGNYQLSDIEIVLNPNPNLGRFYSLYLALQAIDAQHVFVTNADNPFAKIDILKQLWQHSAQADYVCPAYQGKGGHPILISPRIVSAVRAETNLESNLKDYLNRFSKLYIPVTDEFILTNINTPQDYQKLVFINF